MNEEIVYELNKKSIVHLILLFTISGILGILFLVYTPFFVSALIRNEILIKFIGVIAIVSSILFLIGYVRALFYNYGLKISEKGIINNTNLTNIGVIYWYDIISVRVMEVRKSPFVLVFVKGDDKYLKKVNFLKRLNILGYKNTYGTSVVIETKNINCSAEDLKTILEKRVEQSKRIR